MIADRAGVQRHTFYAHFPDEWSLTLACSGEVEARDPLPEAEPWRAIADPGERLRTGLRALYGWYERHAQLVACVTRDAEHHEPTRKISEHRWGPYLAAYREVLGEQLNARQRVLLRLAISFHSWRTLTRDGGLSSADAVKAMEQAIDCAKRAG
jgi:AcrR family transcriptional regulator